MASIVILGGGFAGVAAAEALAKRLGPEHQITLISKQQEFVFYPALVKLAFEQVQVSEITYNLRDAMLDRRVHFIQAEVAYPQPDLQQIVIAHGEIEGKMKYDYLIFAMGRRLATENVRGFYEHAHHLMTVNSALRFREALRDFHSGHAVFGSCLDSRLTVPVFEAAFALDRLLKERGEREQVKISVVGPGHLSDHLGGEEIVPALQRALDDHAIEFIPNFSAQQITKDKLISDTGQEVSHDLLMLLPPFTGPGEAMYTGITDPNGYVSVDLHMRVNGTTRMYAAGDCINLLGPKMGHMAVLQGMVAAANIAAELEGHEAAARYNHELMLVIDEGGKDSIYLQKDLWESAEGSIKQGRFWSWAKNVHQKYWQRLHS